MSNAKYSIYSISCRKQTLYVGMTTDTPNRWKAHKSALRKGRHTNARLQKEWTNHGERSFAFDVIETIDTDDSKHAGQREQYWSEHHNISSGSISSGRHPSDEPKVKKVTLTVYPPDVDYLKTLSRNMSEAVRIAIQQARAVDE